MDESAGPRSVLPLAQCTASAVPAVGGKAANLGELLAAGLPVPDGFVLTTDAYRQVAGLLRVSSQAVAAADPHRAATAAARLRDALAHAAMPAALADAVTSAYVRLGSGAVAVRSSATAEDLPGATFAGQQDTFLGVRGVDAVLVAVRECWASLWTDRAVAYRNRLGIAPGGVAMAVVVQRMVAADVAGVMFTANPVTGARDELAVDASPGLGEAVVSGEVTPDHFRLTPAGTVAEWTAGRREAVHGASAAGRVPPVGSPVLSPADLARLCRLGVRIATHFGRPQDIEWALADGVLWIVQARPMTALPLPPERVNRIQRTMLGVLGDYLTARPYPIDMTSWVPHGAAGMMARIAADVGIVGVFDALFHETDGVVDGARVPRPRPRPRLLTAPFRLAARARRHPLSGWREDPRVAELDRLVRELNDVDVTALTWPDLVAVPRRVLNAVQPVTGLRRDVLPAAGVAIARLAVMLARMRRRRMLAELLHGAPTATTRGNDALEQLARVAARDPGTAAAVRAGDLAGARADGAFATALDRWLNAYGYRELTSPILITTPTLGEMPTAVLALVRVLMDDGLRPAAASDAPLRAVLASVRSDAARARVRVRVRAAQEGIAFREDTHVMFTRLMPALRVALREAGRRLAGAGVLAAADDVYHLRLDELEALPGPDGAAAAAAGRVVRRRAVRRAALDRVPLLNIQRPAAARTGDEILVGTPGGGGRGVGPVRVIRSAGEFARFRTGDVLVCPYTNPSWTPLFLRAAAVVVDSGGPLSHAAIVARECGVPAVLGTATATAVLHDGDVVCVDGQTGAVTPAEA